MLHCLLLPIVVRFIDVIENKQCYFMLCVDCLKLYLCNQGYIIKYVFALLHLFWECSCACERIFLAQRRPTSSINKYITWSLKPVLLPVPANILHYMIYVKYLDTSHFVVQIDSSFVNTDEYCLSWVKLSR